MAVHLSTTRLSYVVSIIGEVGRIDRFTESSDQTEWEPVLRWWLHPSGEDPPDCKSDRKAPSSIRESTL